MDKGVVHGFLGHTNSGCWGWSSLLGDAKPSWSFVSVEDSVQRFEQDCEFCTQSVAPFSSGKSPVVIVLLPSIVRRYRGSLWPDRRQPTGVGVLEQMCVDLRGRQG